MADVFIGFTSHDETLARFVLKHLIASNIGVFLAPAHVQPGYQWSEKILNTLSGAKWAIFLASRAACASPWIQQDLGMSIGGANKLIPVVWDMSPTELPAWTAPYPAINLAGATIEQARAQLVSIADRNQTDKKVGHLLLGLLMAGLVIGQPS